MNEIIDRVDEIIEHYSLKTNTKKQEFVYRRFYLMNFLRINTFLSLSEIAEKFGKMTRYGIGDHSTVIHGIRKHKLLTNDKVYKFHTEAVHNKLLGITPVFSELDKQKLINSVLNCDNFWQMKKLQLQLLEINEN